MPKRFWSNSQKPKRLDQEHAIPSSFSLEKHSGGNSSRSIHSHSGSSSNSHGSNGGRPPLSSQGARTKSSHRKNKMEFGFDPWASPSPTSVAQIPSTRMESSSNGEFEYYDQSREDEFYSSGSNNHGRSKSSSSTDHAYLDAIGTSYQKNDHGSRGRDSDDTYGYRYRYN